MKRQQRSGEGTRKGRREKGEREKGEGREKGEREEGIRAENAAGCTVIG